MDCDLFRFHGPFDLSLYNPRFTEGHIESWLFPFGTFFSFKISTTRFLLVSLHNINTQR